MTNPRHRSSLSVLSLCGVLWALPVDAATVAPTAPPPVLVSQPPLQLELDQTKPLEVAGITRWLVVDPRIASLVRTETGAVEIRALRMGTTFIHLWRDGERQTLYIRVGPKRPPPSVQAELRRQEREAARRDNLKTTYTVQYRHLGRGPTISRTDENTTTSLIQTASGEMPTPHGTHRATTTYQRINTQRDLTFWQTSLTQGRIGRLQDFDVVIGDQFSGLSSLSMPSSRLEGVSVVHRGLEWLDWSAVWGRQEAGGLAATLPGFEEERDAFVGGGQIVLGREDPWRLRTTLAVSRGDERFAQQSDHVIDTEWTYRWTEILRTRAEWALSDEELSYLLGASGSWSRGGLDATFRNIDEEFNTVLGRAPNQGELGALVNSRWQPWDPLQLSGSLNWFRDRLFPNPAEPDVFNRHLRFDANWTLSPRLLLKSYYENREDLGRAFPLEEWSSGASFSTRLPWWRNVSVLSRYDFRESRNVSSPTIDFRSHVLHTGLGMGLGGGFTLTVGNQWNFLEELLSEATSRPRRFTTELSYLSQFQRQRSPWRLQGRVSYVNESEAGAARSFLAGQDRLGSSVGLRYAPSRDLDAFLEGRIEELRRQATDTRTIELEFKTGLRYTLDTGFAWRPRLSVQGIVFEDLNANQARDPSEPGIADMPILAANRRVVTNRHGQFRLGWISGPEATVSLDVTALPKGMTPTSPSSVIVTVREGRRHEVVFGLFRASELRGEIFLDVDHDGVKSPADVPMPEVTLRLDGRLIATTDREGRYLFRNVPSGDHRLELDLESLPLHTTPQVPLRLDLSLPAGESQQLSIPVRAERSLRGRVYVDANENRRFDTADKALSSILVCIDGRWWVKTDEEGRFLFKQMPGGPHEIALNCGQPLEGYIPISRAQLVVTLSPEPQRLEELDFRVQVASVLLERMTKDVLQGRRTDMSPRSTDHSPQ